MSAQTDASRAVRRGAHLLDRLLPEWAEKINTEKLALSSCEACICGQLGYKLWKQLDLEKRPLLNDRYREGRNGLGRLARRLKVRFKGDWGTNSGAASAQFYGFDIGPGYGYGALDRAWQREIRKRTEV